MNTGFLGPAVATVLTVYGIETQVVIIYIDYEITHCVATVLTVYGIETIEFLFEISFCFRLQQCLPFTVLKLTKTQYN